MARVCFDSRLIDAGELGLVPKEKLRAVCAVLEENPERGKPLQRELKGYRTIRVAGVENRLVYRVVGKDDDAIVLVIAIGRRRDDAVYGAAQSRA